MTDASDPKQDTPLPTGEPRSQGQDRAGGQVCLEIVVQSPADARAAQAGGAQRLELCVGLVDGGLTPPATLVARVTAAVDLPVCVLVRPRGGDFVLDDEDLELMRSDIRAAAEAGATGVVVGALNADGQIDVPRLGRLIATARPLDVTFHRAFDHTSDPLEALETLSMLGVDRVLTSGQAPTASEGSDLIAELVAQGRQRPRIMAGGGVTPEHIGRLVAATGVRDVHSSAAGFRPSPARHVNRTVPLGPSDAALRRGVEEGIVRELIEALGT